MKHYYFADYEVQIAASLLRWGNSTLTYEVPGDQAFDPEALVQRLRAEAAEKYGVARSDVRLRNICRL